MIYLIIFYIALHIADACLTYQILKNGQENMPIAAWVMGKLGILPGLIIMKILATIPIIYVYTIYRGTLFWLFLIIASGRYSITVARNYREI